MKPPFCNLVFMILVGCSCFAGLGDGKGMSFTSVEAIKNTMRLDKNIASYLRQHLNEIPESNRHSILEYLNEQQRMEKEIELMPNKEQQKLAKLYREVLFSQMAKNPLHAYQTIRRVVLDVHTIMTLLNKVKPELVEELKAIRGKQKISYQHDFIGAAKGLIRLQGMYNLQAANLVQGKIKHLQTFAKLTVGDCLLLGQVSKETKMDLYVEWMEQAHQLCGTLSAAVQSTGTNKNPCSYTTGQLLAAAAQEHDESFNNHTVQVLPLPISTKCASEQIAEKYASFDPRQEPNLEMNLCYQSGRLMTPAEESQLICYYWVRRENPYVTLERYKVEMHAKWPRIVTIYDVISEAEADLIRELARPRLFRSTVADKTNNRLTPEFSEQRISSTAWVSDRDHPKVRKISQRIARITGLNVTGRNSEHFQVVNYGIGGMYNAHHDYLFEHQEMNNLYKRTMFMGNRIVTFILYLSDVELGGATVFPYAKTAIRPKKGAAAMWFNINEYGIPNPASFHGGCPVLYGSKWISNKWILEKGQMFLFPCPVSPF